MTRWRTIRPRRAMPCSSSTRSPTWRLHLHDAVARRQIVRPPPAALLAAPVTVAEPDVVGPLGGLPADRRIRAVVRLRLRGRPRDAGTSGAAGARRGEGARVQPVVRAAGWQSPHTVVEIASGRSRGRRASSGGCGEEGWELMKARTGTRGVTHVPRRATATPDEALRYPPRSPLASWNRPSSRPRASPV
jgi:hypothetical protein